MTTDDRDATAMRRVAHTALALLFVVAVGAGLLGTMLGLATGGLEGENRTMAPPPDPTVGLRRVRRQVDAWVDDHFGFRNPLVELHGRIVYGVFGVSPRPDVVPGRDGWLFYAVDRIIESRRGIVPFTRAELGAWQARLEERRDWLAARGIRYVFTVAPEKSSLYAELLPPALQPVGDESRTDQLFAWLGAHSTVATLDARAALRAVKDTDRLYHRTDTHWNDVGAFAAYRQLATWLQAEFPAVRPLGLADVERYAEVGMAGDLAAMMGVRRLMSEERIRLVPGSTSVRPADPTPTMRHRVFEPDHDPKVFTCASGEIGRAVIVHDSFYQAVQPFLARHFRRSTFVRAVFAPEIIAEEQPDVVIEEMKERLLSRDGFLPPSELAIRKEPPAEDG